MVGILAADSTTHRVIALPGTPIRAFGGPLWDAGLCLKNQGDIDTQHIAGAIATATHGSGEAEQSFSATVRGLRAVLASGELIEVGEDQPDLLAAMQVSLGTLGIITQIELNVRPAFALREQIDFWPVDEVLDRWDAEMRDRRHFSFFWMPSADSADLLFMDTPSGMNMADQALVKRYDELPAAAADNPDAYRTEGTRRIDRPYRIYPDPDFEGPIVNRELEYMVPYDRGKEAFGALRRFLLEQRPDNGFPVEVRAIAGDDAWLSPFYERDSVSISICGHEHRGWTEFLRQVHDVLLPFQPRPHFGKVHQFSAGTLAAALPRFGDFQATRRRLDPDGVLLNASLAALLM
jgi:FAD/FMN-containing dehydrogenase